MRQPLQGQLKGKKEKKKIDKEGVREAAAPEDDGKGANYFVSRAT
jgi:hypothetical protein